MAHGADCICRRVIYGGRVQGVGFRWTANRIARALDVRGHVRNLADGTVELLVQGPADQVDAMLEQLSVVMSGNIEHASVTEESVRADLEGFGIRS